MVILRDFQSFDSSALQEQYTSMSIGDIQSMIYDWNKREYQGRYFEMFAVVNDGVIVGTISLYQHTVSVVSIGPEIFPAYRRRGFGKEAMLLVLRTAREKGYKIVAQQIQCDNAPSIALHESLGFETDRYIYTNRKGKEVFLFYKALL